MNTDLIMCIADAHLKSHFGRRRGFIPYSGSVNNLFPFDRVVFGRRDLLEQDPTFRQIIPYIVLMHGGAVGVYTRSRQGHEKRLAEKRSIGFGGHVVTSDVGPDVAATIEAAGVREVTEEVYIDLITNCTSLGIIYDDSTDVNRVHVGVVQLWSVASETISPIDKEVASAQFVPLTDIDPNDGFESWSQFCLKHLQE